MTIKAVIFDLDGLLVDSEPLWQEAEILVFQEVNITLTSELCLRTKGLRIDEVVDYWYQQYPWTNLSKQEIEKAIVVKVIELIYLKGKPLPGVDYAISFVRQKQVKIALASSSSLKIIQATLEKLNLTEVFTEIYSAESEILGKPHPGVYLTTANKLNVTPQECLALEDSLNGVLAAKAAQMKCIAIPELGQQNNLRFAIADKILRSLTELNDEIWDSLN
ncbi:hexitol phosphatase HxpB [Waterburya agarophytonicola K14]|uniref:Hexitol phosphatase HxpB n=1 Tax=Waterburya agarophytonicola KI4 TaxID=2874699 RepID=A0A964BNA1_9CYAN|nr:hexitol phosphatase HxpB [Waterburya agarophytonicola]MCC0176214.1 hexitol phosphatase HxpB [Waterburya agarophytonicola KI4]